MDQNRNTPQKRRDDTWGDEWDYNQRGPRGRAEGEIRPDDHWNHEFETRQGGGAGSALRKYIATPDPAVLKIEAGPIADGTGIVEFTSAWAVFDPILEGSRYLYMGLDLHCEFTPKQVLHDYNLSLYQLIYLSLDGKQGPTGVPEIMIYPYDTTVWHTTKTGQPNAAITQTSDITAAHNFLIGNPGSWDYIRLRIKIDNQVGKLDKVIAAATRIEIYTHDGTFAVGTQVFPV